MSSLSCSLAQAVIAIVNLYSIVLLVYAILSWIPDLRGPWVRYISAIVEPVLIPIRRVVPPLGGFDLAFLVLLLGLQLIVRPFLYSLASSVCL